MVDRNDGEWFAPKRFGFGAGPPISWQGWAILGGYLAMLVLMSVLLLPRHERIWGVVVAVATFGLLIITAQHTRGGFRWRWGKDA